jgi:stalled ribosome alternative rescue factor ArfA
LAYQRGSKNYNLKNKVHSNLFCERCEKYIKGNLK